MEVSPDSHGTPNGNGSHLNCQGRSVIRDAAGTTIVYLWKRCCRWPGQVRRGAICRTNLANSIPSTRASGGGRKVCGSKFRIRPHRCGVGPCLSNVRASAPGSTAVGTIEAPTRLEGAAARRERAFAGSIDERLRAALHGVANTECGPRAPA